MTTMPSDPKIEIDEARLSAAFLDQGGSFLRNLTGRIETGARAQAPKRSGRLAAATSADDVHADGPWSLRSGVTTHVPYALFVHEPTRPHLIFPRTTQFLRFTVKGKTIFAKRVRHPGTAGQPFLRHAAEQAIATDPHVK
jgi:hypothetical protein